MGVQYRTKVEWDTTLIDLEFTDTMNSVANGLVEKAVKITTGAPTATAGKFMPAAKIQNAVDATEYMNTGSTASPVWTLVNSAGLTPAYVTKFAGTATGGTTATRAYTITGAASTDIVGGIAIRASTNAASIQKATLTTNTLTVLFSTDPGASTTVDYSIVRAAS